MSTHEDYSRHHEARGSSDRAFGLVFTAFFLWVAFWPLRAHHPARIWAALVAAAFLLIALAAPRVLGSANRAWMKLGLLLGRIMNPVVMTVLFYVVFTPVAWVMRRMGKDPLKLKLDRSAGSYWIDRRGAEPGSMVNQF